jgi:copper chaperone CopZ
MQTKTFTVPNIGCDNCVRTIKNELNNLQGVVRVEGIVSDKRVTVEWDEPASWQQIADLLKEIDYAPAE